MGIEVALLREPLVAMRTRVRPLAGVNPLVGDQVTLLGESFLADFARVWSLGFCV